jgi:hypothetical protein
MMTISRLRWVLMAAVSAGVASTAATAMAQYRVGSDGRSHDANNRIGSGGINDAQATPAGPVNQYQLNNSIVTGQVTGGRQFRGFVPYSDPNVFHGITAGSLSDNFIKQSSGASYGGINQNNAQQVTQFYGSDRATAVPPGFVQQGQGGGFVPAPAVVREPNDFRLGETLNVPTALLPQPGQLVLPGPVDPNTQTSSVITASPLYGVRQWNMGSEADQNFLFGASPANLQGARMDPAALQHMREELTQSALTDQTAGGEDVGAAANTGDARTGMNPRGDRTGTGDAKGGTMQTPFDSPQNQSLNSAASMRSSSVNKGSALNANLVTGEGTRNRLLTAPERQSTQYAALKDRLARYRSANELGDTSAAREFQAQMREQKLKQQQKQPGVANAGGTGQAPGQPGAMANQPGNPPGTGMGTGMGTGTTTPGMGSGTNVSGQQPKTGELARPGVGAMPGTTPPGGEQGQAGAATPAKPEIPGSISTDQNKPQPLQVHSLAEGVQAKGLADLLKEAENMMKSGKYSSALEQYELADQVAPNNPLILLGRANAELGQSYYTRAENHLRQAFMKDQALLMGQYDLRTWLGQDRLEFLSKDLREIANRETKEARPLFLLAYIAYNTGNERRGAAYLDLAEKRAGGNDPLYPLLRKYWALPTDAAPANDVLNK